MARRYSVSLRKGVSFWGVIMTLVKFLIAMYAGGLVIDAIVSTVNFSGDAFEEGFNLLGITQADTASAATISTTGLIGVASVLAAVFVVMKFVRVKRV